MFCGEQLLVQTVDKKLTLTTHRLIQKYKPWDLRCSSSVMLEDITNWEVKTLGNTSYLTLGVLAALMVYYDDSFALISGFFVMLYMMTRRNCIQVTTPKQVMILSLDIQHDSANSLAEMVRQARKDRLKQVKSKAQNSLQAAA
nr:hypothetical protein [Pontibacter harenae]